MSQRDSGYERRPHDLYETPDWVTAALIPHLPAMSHPWPTIWEPACGSGAMCKSLSVRMAFCPVYGTDLQTGVDFLLTSEPVFETHAIITNPPYTHATEFCEHALRLMEPVAGVVAMLLNTNFAHAKSRQYLFRDCPAYAKKVELQKRITWFKPEPGAKGKSPSENHAWFIWDWRHEGPAIHGFAP